MKRLMLSLSAIGLLLVPALAAETSTADNLKAAHQASLDAKARYEAFAAKAGEEGYKSAAALFRAAAKSEDIHIAKYASVLKELGVEAKAEAAKPEVKTTRENAEAAIKDKTANRETLLPGHVKAAEADKQKKAVMFFKGAIAADGECLKLFEQAKGNLDGWKAGDKEFLVCTVCSYVMAAPAPGKCPICSASNEKYESFK
ncbi:MAG TPA: ferritin family protein [Planctomycetota bacterium]|nr:ferritin family protein [Planctomycetota bacterium]